MGYTPVAALTCSSRCHLNWLQTAALGPRSAHILGPWDDEPEKRPVEALKAAQGSGGRELQGYLECVLQSAGLCKALGWWYAEPQAEWAGFWAPTLESTQSDVALICFIYCAPVSHFI